MATSKAQKESTIPHARPSRAGRRLLGTPTDILINASIFSAASVLHVVSYQTAAPILIAGAIYFFWLSILTFTSFGGPAELRIFSRTYCAGFLAAGVAAIYATIFLDTYQLYRDAGRFFEMATQGSVNLTLEEVRPIHEGSLAIIIWREVYQFFSSIGFEKEPYIGVALNVLAVALSAVTGLKSLRQIFGEDEQRFRRLTLLMSTSGLLWLFAGIHLRDSFVLLGISILAHYWIRLLSQPRARRLLETLAVSAALAVTFYYLRAEFIFIPIAAAIAGVFSLLIGKSENRHRLIKYGLLLTVGSTATGLLLVFGDTIFLAFNAGQESYLTHNTESHGGESLGLALMNLPVLLRIVAGSAYLLLFPIPVWSGFQLDSAYSLFKSFNAIFFYVALPLAALGAWSVLTSKALRSPSTLFTLFFAGGMTCLIAGTSLESRHLGAFLTPILLVACAPDLRQPIVRRRFKRLLALTMLAVIAVHMAWAALKFL